MARGGGGAAVVHLPGHRRADPLRASRRSGSRSTQSTSLTSSQAEARSVVRPARTARVTSAAPAGRSWASPPPARSAMAFLFVMLPLRARRVGLLSPFMGILGVVAGALIVFRGQLPGTRHRHPGLLARSARGAPARALAGRARPRVGEREAEPWPTAAQRRGARADAGRGARARPHAAGARAGAGAAELAQAARQRARRLWWKARTAPASSPWRCCSPFRVPLVVIAVAVADPATKRGLRVERRRDTRDRDSGSSAWTGRRRRSSGAVSAGPSATPTAAASTRTRTFSWARS